MTRVDSAQSLCLGSFITNKTTNSTEKTKMNTKNNHKFAVSSMSLLSRKSLLASRLQSVSAILALVLATTSSSFAGSATWKASPATGDWSTATNWTPATVPNGPTDTATFATSNLRSSRHRGRLQRSTASCSTRARARSRSQLLSPTLTISGAGITNNSGITQNFASGPGEIDFLNSATAGSSNVVFTNTGNMNSSETRRPRAVPLSPTMAP